MNYLFIDGSENATYAQAGNSNNYFQQTFDTNRNLAAKITDICDEILAQASLTSDQVDIFAVCNGPGSLTGLRVANSFLRTLAFLNDKPLAGIDLFSWSAATLKADGHKNPVWLMAPTLIDKAFVLEVDLAQNLDGFNAKPELCDKRLPHPELPSYGMRWQSEGITRVEPDAEVLHQLIIRQNEAKADFSQLLQVLPMYVIPSQAERKLEEKQC